MSSGPKIGIAHFQRLWVNRSLAFFAFQIRTRVEFSFPFDCKKSKNCPRRALAVCRAFSRLTFGLLPIASRYQRFAEPRLLLESSQPYSEGAPDGFFVPLTQLPNVQLRRADPIEWLVPASSSPGAQNTNNAGHSTLLELQVCCPHSQLRGNTLATGQLRKVRSRTRTKDVYLRRQ